MQVSMSSWLEALPAMIAAGVVLFVPGGLVAAAAGARGYRLWAVATPLSFTLAATAAILFSALGISFTIASFGALSILVAAVTFAVRRWIQRKSFAEVHPLHAPTALDLRRRTWGMAVAVGAGLLIGSVMIGGRLLIAIGAPTEIAQLFDNIFHLNATAIIHQTGVGSSLTLGNLTPASAGFYPAALHDMAALVMGLGVEDVAVALNAVPILLACLVWPLSLTFLTTRLFGMRADVVVFTGLVSGSLAAFPFRMFSFGVLYPFLAGMAMIPVIIALVVELFGMSRSSRTSFLGISVTLAAIGPGIALTHPSVVIAATVFTAPFAVDLLLRECRKAPPSAWGIALGSAYLVVSAALFVLIRPALDTAPWQPTEDYRQAIGSIVSVSPGTGAMSWLAIVLLLAGLAVAARHPRRYWPTVGTFVIAGAIYFGAAALAHPALRDFVSGVWYRDPERAGALLAVAASPVLVLGAASIARLTRRGLSQLRAMGSDVAMHAASITVVAVLGIASSLFGPLPQAQDWVRQSFGHDGQALLTDDEHALLLRTRDLVPIDGVIVGNPLTGASLTPAFSGRAALAPHVFGQRTDAESYLLQHWSQAGRDPAVCPLIAELNAYWAIDFGDQGVYRGQISVLRGTEDLAAIAGKPGSGAAITEIARVGDAGLFEASACMPSP